MKFSILSNQVKELIKILLRSVDNLMSGEFSSQLGIDLRELEVQLFMEVCRGRLLPTPGKQMKFPFGTASRYAETGINATLLKCWTAGPKACSNKRILEKTFETNDKGTTSLRPVNRVTYHIVYVQAWTPTRSHSDYGKQQSKNNNKGGINENNNKEMRETDTRVACSTALSQFYSRFRKVKLILLPLSCSKTWRLPGVIYQMFSRHISWIPPTAPIVHLLPFSIP